MKREVLAGITGLSIIVGTLVPSEPSSAEEQKTSQSGHNINADTLPNRLPSDVAKNIGAVVGEELQYDINPNAQYNLYNPYANIYFYAGSAVRLSKNQYLSAGHLAFQSTIYQSPAQEQSILDKPCSNFYIDLPSKKRVKTYGPYGELFDLTGTSVPVAKVVGSYVNDMTTDIPDIALFQSQNVDFPPPSHEPAQPIIKIAPKPPKIGQAVYFVNFESLNGIERSPSESVVQTLNGVNGNYNPTMYPSIFTKPAIFGGIYTGKEKNGLDAVVDGTKSYDKLGDTLLTPAGSGGAVENSSGQLVGISVTASPADNLFPTKVFEQEMGVKLKNYSSNDLLQAVSFEPVSTHSVHVLKEELEKDNGGCPATVSSK